MLKELMSNAKMTIAVWKTSSNYSRIPMVIKRSVKPGKCFAVNVVIIVGLRGNMFLIDTMLLTRKYDSMCLNTTWLCFFSADSRIIRRYWDDGGSCLFCYCVITQNFAMTHNQRTARIACAPTRAHIYLFFFHSATCMTGRAGLPPLGAQGTK